MAWAEQRPGYSQAGTISAFTFISACWRLASSLRLAAGRIRKLAIRIMISRYSLDQCLNPRKLEAYLPSKGFSAF
jgi:hypothetical protein